MLSWVSEDEHDVHNLRRAFIFWQDKTIEKKEEKVNTAE